MTTEKVKTYMVNSLITLALVLWGWQNNSLLLAVLLPLPLWLTQQLQWRLDITDKNFNRVADFTSIIFFLFIVFQFSTRSAHGIFSILAALPYLFSPLIFAQHFSQAGDVPLQSLFISMRKKSRELGDIERINLNYPYLLVVLISSSAGHKQDILFYICISLIAAISLYSIRPKRIKPFIWVPLLLLSIGMGYVLQNGLKIAQNQLEMMASTFIEQIMWRNRDPDKTRTAFGYIGKLKLSDQIHVRVKSDQAITNPVLLREASYTDFRFGLWSNDDSEFEPVDPTLEKEWIFNQTGKTPKNRTLNTYTISTYFNSDRAVIPLPHGIVKINNVPATEAEMNKFGAVNLGVKPGWVRYDAYFDDQILGEKPGETDLNIHNNYRPVLIKLANELDLHSKTPNEAIRTIEQFFRNNFSYSLEQYRRMKGKNRLEDFLYHRREGHCEYFATATTLLLRAAGIPARYTVGYSVQEYSPFENQYVARARDAHSWVIAYVDDKWITLDTTPPIWAPMEAEDEVWWQPLADLWSWLSYSFTTWKDYREEGNSIFIYLLLALVIIYFFWRLFTDSRFISIKQKTPPPGNTPEKPGQNSPIYKLTRQLEENGEERPQGMTLHMWLLAKGNYYKNSLLLPLLDLHYRYRFDPEGLSQNELMIFEDGVNKLLELTNHHDEPSMEV
jgi:transglutaminase-like putative cysteine protease